MPNEDDAIPQQRLTQADIDAVMERLKNPPPPPKPGEPGYELDQLINCCMECKRDRRDKEAPYCDFCKPPPNYPQVAPEGQVFVCGACGKTAKNRDGDRRDDGYYSWDESCMLNAVLCYEEKGEDGNWVAVGGY